ncbi:MAG: zinc-ribbon domain-containing protein [Thermoplasmata archaeon]|nr:zinc-ribbon domain-containing protein [Thermoplasmata archaeon]
MYCTKCGTQNVDDSIYCKQCGSDLKAGTGGPAPPPTRPRKSKHDEECEEDPAGVREQTLPTPRPRGGCTRERKAQICDES